MTTLTTRLSQATEPTKGPTMNPDPLEVLKLLQGRLHLDKLYSEARQEMLRDATGSSFDEHMLRVTMQAAAAIIAQHYAPLVAEVERLQGGLERIADPRNIHFAGDAQVVAANALGEKS